ncbi:hypothetical protein [Halomicrobium katesii]|nr:hypothetical protein [Halomicrobium katesii]
MTVNTIRIPTDSNNVAETAVTCGIGLVEQRDTTAHCVSVANEDEDSR